MAWFAKLCRNAGLMIHHAIKPSDQQAKRQVMNKQVQEKKVSPTTTVRRTTIDEIEVTDKGSGEGMDER